MARRYPLAVSKTGDFRDQLAALPIERWESFLAENSNLPGPRANLELLFAFVEEAPADLIRRLAGSDDEYLAACAAAGLGRLAAEGDALAAGDMRRLAEDQRWRVREGVAMGLQRLGDDEPAALMALCKTWMANGSWLVQRAVVAGLCEPRLLEGALPMGEVFDVLDESTSRIEQSGREERSGPGLRTLRQALGYCWSVAVAASPGPGFDRLERWASSTDHDVRWIVAENAKKARLRRADPVRWGRLSG